MGFHGLILCQCRHCAVFQFDLLVKSVNDLCKLTAVILYKNFTGKLKRLKQGNRLIVFIASVQRISHMKLSFAFFTTILCVTFFERHNFSG